MGGSTHSYNFLFFIFFLKKSLKIKNQCTIYDTY